MTRKRCPHSHCRLRSPPRAAAGEAVRSPLPRSRELSAPRSRSSRRRRAAPSGARSRPRSRCPTSSSPRRTWARSSGRARATSTSRWTTGSSTIPSTRARTGSSRSSSESTASTRPRSPLDHLPASAGGEAQARGLPRQQRPQQHRRRGGDRLHPKPEADSVVCHLVLLTDRVGSPGTLGSVGSLPEIHHASRVRRRATAGLGGARA
jgi:hypothetical protein